MVGALVAICFAEVALSVVSAAREQVELGGAPWKVLMEGPNDEDLSQWAVCRRELMSTDVAASVVLYRGVRLEGRPMKMPTAGLRRSWWRRQSVGGIMKLPVPERSGVLGRSVFVDDVDATAKKAAAAGGQVIVPPTRRTVAAGPLLRVRRIRKVRVDVWRGNGDGEHPAPGRCSRGVGMFCWEQLEHDLLDRGGLVLQPGLPAGRTSARPRR